MCHPLGLAWCAAESWAQGIVYATFQLICASRLQHFLFKLELTISKKYLSRWIKKLIMISILERLMQLIAYCMAGWTFLKEGNMEGWMSFWTDYVSHVKSEAPKLLKYWTLAGVWFNLSCYQGLFILGVAEVLRAVSLLHPPRLCIKPVHWPPFYSQANWGTEDSRMDSLNQCAPPHLVYPGFVSVTMIKYSDTNNLREKCFFFPYGQATAPHHWEVKVVVTWRSYAHYIHNKNGEQWIYVCIPVFSMRSPFLSALGPAHESVPISG